MDLKQREYQGIREFIKEIDQAFKVFIDKNGRGDKDVFEFAAMRRRVKRDCLFKGMRPEIFKKMRADIKNPKKDSLWSEITEAAQDAEWLWSLHHRRTNFVGLKLSSASYTQHDFSLDDDEYVIVYTDGACLRNGQPNADAGLGVWFGEDHDLNVSEPVRGVYPATNNVAEIKAVVTALKIAKKYGVGRLAVYTDSMYLMDSVTRWIYKWLLNGWKRFDGEPLKNRKQFRELLRAMEDMDIEWIHVRGHSHHKGNIMADKLAKEGALKSPRRSSVSRDSQRSSNSSC